MATVRNIVNGNSIIRLEIQPFSTRITDDLPPEQLNRKYAITEHIDGVMVFRNLDDPSKYQSAEFAAIGVDELTKNDKEVFDFLRTRKRWPGIPHTKFISGTNPGGKGHNWVKIYMV